MAADQSPTPEGNPRADGLVARFLSIDRSQGQHTPFHLAPDAALTEKVRVLAVAAVRAKHEAAAAASIQDTVQSDAQHVADASWTDAKERPPTPPPVAVPIAPPRSRSPAEMLARLTAGPATEEEPEAPPPLTKEEALAGLTRVATADMMTKAREHFIEAFSEDTPQQAWRRAKHGLGPRQKPDPVQWWDQAIVAIVRKHEHALYERLAGLFKRELRSQVDTANRRAVGNERKVCVPASIVAPVIRVPSLLTPSLDARTEHD